LRSGLPDSDFPTLILSLKLIGGLSISQDHKAAGKVLM
jgi:hypothetical protein